MNRRDFNGLLVALMSLNPSLPIVKSKLKITVKLHNPIFWWKDKNGNYKSLRKPKYGPVTHQNIRKDCYLVFENDQFIGKLYLHYLRARGSEASIRCSAYKVTFVSFFGLIVKKKDVSLEGRSWLREEPQNEKLVEKIAEDMRNLAVEKTERMVKRYNNYLEKSHA